MKAAGDGCRTGPHFRPCEATCPDPPASNQFLNLATGVTMLVSSVVAGILWDMVGPTGTFVAGGAFAVIAAVLLIGWRFDSISR